MGQLGVLPAKKPHSEAPANRRKTMNKIKMLTLATLGAATVATGALAGPRVASAATATSATSASSNLERPKICFVFGPWKYCI
jgi:hypothetical protein